MRPHKGFEMVGAWLVPKKEAGPYKRARKQAMKQARAAMESFCARVELSYKGSEDGEALVGYDKKGEAIALIHLDPEGVKAIGEAVEKGNLVEMLKKY